MRNGTLSAKAATGKRNMMANHAAAIMGERLDDIDSAAVLEVLAPIWADHYATAKQIKGNVGEVLDWAIAQGHRQDNPITTVTKALPKPKEHKVQLSRQAVAVLEQAKAHSEGDSVFGGSAASLKQTVGRAMHTRVSFASSTNPKNPAAFAFLLLTMAEPPPTRLKFSWKQTKPFISTQATLRTETLGKALSRA